MNLPQILVHSSVNIKHQIDKQKTKCLNWEKKIISTSFNTKAVEDNSNNC